MITDISSTIVSVKVSWNCLLCFYIRVPLQYIFLIFLIFMLSFTAGCDVYWSGHEGSSKAASSSSSPCGQTGDAGGCWVRDAVHARHGSHCHLIYTSAQCSGESEGTVMWAGHRCPSVTWSPSHTSALWLYNELLSKWLSINVSCRRMHLSVSESRSDVINVIDW